MKQRPNPLSKYDAETTLNALTVGLSRLSQPADVRAFLEDLCTPAELEAMSERWKVVPLLLEGLPYREIHERTRVSVTTIGRVARTLEHGKGGYALAVRQQFPHLSHFLKTPEA